MLDTIKRYLKVFFSVRLLPVLVVYILLFALLINRMFQLQIVKGDEYEKESQQQATKTWRECIA